jgi:hypothetical protein
VIAFLERQGQFRVEPRRKSQFRSSIRFPHGKYQHQKKHCTMKTKIILECDSFNRSLVFAKANSADIPATSKGPGYVTTLDGIYTQLVAAGATQKPISVTAQNALILGLDQKLDIMAIIAKAYAATTPGFDDAFPRCAHLNPGEVLRTANAYLAKLAPAAGDDAATTAAKTARVQVFVDHAMPATLVADLQGQLKQIGDVSGTHEESREEGVLSTEEINQLVNQGRVQRDLLGAIFQTVYAANPQKLAAWSSASHVEHTPHHATAPTPTPTPATTATK